MLAMASVERYLSNVGLPLPLPIQVIDEASISGNEHPTLLPQLVAVAEGASTNEKEFCAFGAPLPVFAVCFCRECAITSATSGAESANLCTQWFHY
jgi:hypothetical protein